MRFLILLITLIIPVVAYTQKDETTLFDHDGKPVAYITASDKTIYLWDGRPVAYLSGGQEQLNIYGFNGKHLGWFVKGIIRDHDGYQVGFVKGATTVYTLPESFKEYKKAIPFKLTKEFPPYYVPYFSAYEFSKTPLAEFLALGVDD